MRKFHPINLFAFGLIFFCGSLFSQVPEGGTQLNATTGTSFTKSGKVTLTQVDVTDQAFTKALRLVTANDVSNPWDAQILFPPTAGIATNDVILVAFYARTVSSIQETGEGFLTVVIENSSSYAKEIYLKLSIGSEWKQYYASVKSASTWTAAQIRYSLFAGFTNQTVEIADVRYLNYFNSLTLDDLPLTEITYSGRDPEAAWRAPAAARIDQVRKGIVEVVVYDEQGQLVPDAKVSIVMIKHQFGFGTAIPASVFLSNTVFRNKVYELFNEVVFENDLKWPQFNPNSTLNLRKSLDSLEKHSIPVRGHNVIWPAWRWCPTTLQSLSTNPVALRNEIDKHIDQVTQFTSGRLNDWDVINEPYSEKDIMAILGNDVMADWLKRTRQNDRDVKLYINDYGILSSGGLDTQKQDSYYNLINFLDERGAGVNGIGMQGHFSSDLTPITRVYSILDRFGELGKDIKITEHDIETTQRAVQADYTRDFMTIAFSHPSVKSILVWGFWAGSHWKPDAAFYNLDWSVRPHGEVWKEMIYNQWWTKMTDSVTDLQGKTSFEGFLGTYKYTIVSGDKERSGTFTIANPKQSGIANTIVLSFDEAVPDNFGISANKPTMLCEGESLTLTAPSITDATYQWFKGEEQLTETSSEILVNEAGKYSVKAIKGLLELHSDSVEVSVNPIPEATVTVGGDLAFCPGGKVKLSTNLSNDATYNWMKGSAKIQGSVSSIEVSESGSYTLVANSKGCTATSQPVTVEVYSANSPECTVGIDALDHSFRVYPNPFNGSFFIDAQGDNHYNASAELFDVLGCSLVKKKLDGEQGSYLFSVDAPGVYTLRIQHNEGIQTYRLIGN